MGAKRHVVVSAVAILSWIIPTIGAAQDQAFPHCALDPTPRAAFLERYAQGHLAIASEDFERARDHLERALELCPDSEVIWFLARVHERLGKTEVAERLDETWRTQRELQGLSLDAPRKPDWVTARPASSIQRTLALDDTTPRSSSSPGTSALPLPSVYKLADTVSALDLGAFPRAATLARLSIQVAPIEGATLWLSDGTFLGGAPLDEVMIPADTDLVIVLKVDDKQVLVRTVRAEPRTHQRLFLTVPH